MTITTEELERLATWAEEAGERDASECASSLREAADRIENLTAERDTLAEKLERVVRALKPFAIIAKHHAADAPEWGPFDSMSAQVLVMYLEDAATTLAAIQEKTHDFPPQTPPEKGNART